MSKKNFITLILGVIGGMFFALGMCMALLPEWNVFTPGVILGTVGVAVLLAMWVIRRKMSGKAPIRLSAKTLLTVVFGIVGALVMGTGMSCCLVWGNALFFPGIVGMALIAAAYPVYKNITVKEREKIAPEILRLTDELMR